MNRQAGFNTLEIVLSIAVVGVLSFVGFHSYLSSRIAKQKPNTNYGSADPTVNLPAAPNFKEAKDIGASIETLNSVNLDSPSQDLAQLESELEL
jgi:hypothetical protein